MVLERVSNQLYSNCAFAKTNVRISKDKWVIRKQKNKVPLDSGSGVAAFTNFQIFLDIFHRIRRPMPHELDLKVSTT